MECFDEKCQNEKTYEHSYGINCYERDKLSGYFIAFVVFEIEFPVKNIINYLGDDKTKNSR
jgi:hypothetical protein